jgi:hypothetical protein
VQGIFCGGTIEPLNERLDAAPIWLPPKDETESSRQVSSHDWRARIVTAKDLQVMTFPPARHILPGYISEGATIVAGKPKIGKSWLTLDLCLAGNCGSFHPRYA